MQIKTVIQSFYLIVGAGLEHILRERYGNVAQALRREKATLKQNCF